jgi:drug/metabolite transporter (DMT)-like permease
LNDAAAARRAQPARGLPLLMMTVMLMWGVNIPVVKALTGVIDVVWVGVIRQVEATAVLTLLLLFRDRRLPRLSRAQWWTAAQIAFLMIYLNQLLFTQGTRLSSATNTSLVMALMPLLSLIGGALAFREPVSGRALLGLALGFGGVALVVLVAPGAQVAAAGLGELVVMAGLVTFIGGGLLVQRVTRDLDVLVMGWSVYVMGTAMLLTHAVLLGGWSQAAAAIDGPWIWFCVLYSGIFGTALGNVGWYYAIDRVGQNRASPYLYWIPIVGVAASALLLREPLSGWHAAGLVMVMAGTRLGVVKRGPVPAR